MIDMTSAIKNTISISMFNKGQAGKIFDDVKKNGAKVVIKNNNPECVLLSPEEYVNLMDEVNENSLWKIANDELSKKNKIVTFKQLMKKYQITEEDLLKFAEN